MSATLFLVEQPATSMLSVEEALSEMIKQVKPITTTQSVSLDKLCGRVLATDVVSPLNFPSFDNSAMDGYAISSQSNHKEGLRIKQRVAAGDDATALSPNHAARIFTGAKIPPGADTVVMQEFCEIRDGLLFIKAPFKVGDHIRIEGHSITKGNIVLSKGTLAKPQHVGLIASLGLDSALVTRPPRVAIFSTGDELVSPGKELQPGQIYNSNLPTLIALLQSQGCEIIQSGIIPDDFEQTRSTLKAASQSADIIVTSGGVSVGEEDHVKSALEAEGVLSIWKVRMKPGKPVAFGRIQNALFMGLPGNPVSTFVTSMLFLLPVLRHMTGRVSQDDLSIGSPFQSGYARLGTDWKTPKPRREFIRVKLVFEAGNMPWAQPLAGRGSDAMSSLTSSDALLEMPEYKTFRHGDALRYWNLNHLCN